MITLIDRIESRSNNGRTAVETTTPAERLRTTMAACRVQFTWFGTKKSLTAEQKAQAAETFDAEGQFLSAGKKLLDTKHSAFRAVTAIRTKITDTWRGLTLPFPEPGIRLLKHDQVETFDQQMADYKAELDDAVKTLDRMLRGAQAGGCPATRIAVQPRGLSSDAGRPLRRLLGLSQHRAAGLPARALAGPLPAGTGAGESALLMRPFSLPSRRFWTSSPSWSLT